MKSTEYTTPNGTSGRQQAEWEERKPSSTGYGTELPAFVTRLFTFLEHQQPTGYAKSAMMSADILAANEFAKQQLMLAYQAGYKQGCKDYRESVERVGAA